MQDELHVLQPQQIDTSEETEKLMIKIEQDTVDVEEKKEVCIVFVQKGWYFHVVYKWTVLWKLKRNRKFCFLMPSKDIIYHDTCVSPIFHCTFQIISK
jgi:hypothetical protein